MESKIQFRNSIFNKYYSKVKSANNIIKNSNSNSVYFNLPNLKIYSGYSLNSDFFSELSNYLISGKINNKYSKIAELILYGNFYSKLPEKSKDFLKILSKNYLEGNLSYDKKEDLLLEVILKNINKKSIKISEIDKIKDTLEYKLLETEFIKREINKTYFQKETTRYFNCFVENLDDFNIKYYRDDLEKIIFASRNLAFLRRKDSTTPIEINDVVNYYLTKNFSEDFSNEFLNKTNSYFLGYYRGKPLSDDSLNQLKKEFDNLNRRFNYRESKCDENNVYYIDDLKILEEKIDESLDKVEEISRKYQTYDGLDSFEEKLELDKSIIDCLKPKEKVVHLHDVKDKIKELDLSKISNSEYSSVKEKKINIEFDVDEDNNVVTYTIKHKF
jgi:hypothetical protein